MSQKIENQQKTSLKYTVMTPRLHQNERNRAFGMLVAGISVNALQVCVVALVLFDTCRLKINLILSYLGVVAHNLVRRYD